MKQLLLTPTETGIIYGVMPFISFFVRPLIGALADKTKRHKLVLIVCTLLTGIFYCMLLLTPTKEIRSTKVVTGFECNTYDSFVSDCSPSFEPENNKKDSCPSELRLVNFFNEYIKGNDSSIECSLTCNRVLVSNDDLQVCFTNDIQSINEDSCENWKASGNSVLNFSVNLNRLIDDKIIPTNLSGQGQSCENYNLKNVSFRGQMYWQAVCNMETLFKCEVTCNAYHTKACELDNFGKTFWIFFVIFLFGNIAFAPVLSLVDAIAYDMLGERRGFWGIQRMWGTVGFAIFAIGSGIGNKILSDMNISVHFSVSFLLFLGLTVASSAITLFLKFSENIHCSQIFQNTCQLLKSYKIAVFFVLIASFGIMNAVTEAFLYWYVMLLGGNTITIGLCLLANCLPEILVLFFSGAIIKKIGHMTCFCMGLFSYVIRFFAYSIITDPWLIIPVELIHCLSFALMYAAASSYASMIAPEGTMATMQGLVGGLYFGFGMLLCTFVCYII